VKGKGVVPSCRGLEHEWKLKEGKKHFVIKVLSNANNIRPLSL